MTLLTQRSTLFPYTTLFRSQLGIGGRERLGVLGEAADVVEGDGLELVEVDLLVGVGAVGVEQEAGLVAGRAVADRDRKSTRLNSSHSSISYAVFCLKKKNLL